LAWAPWSPTTTPRSAGARWRCPRGVTSRRRSPAAARAPRTTTPGSSSCPCRRQWGRRRHGGPRAPGRGRAGTTNPGRDVRVGGGVRGGTFLGGVDGLAIKGKAGREWREGNGCLLCLRLPSFCPTQRNNRSFRVPTPSLPLPSRAWPTSRRAHGAQLLGAPCQCAMLRCIYPSIANAWRLNLDSLSS